MPRFLRIMRYLTAILFLAAVLLICWQVFDIYADGIADISADSKSMYRTDDISRRFKLLTAPLSAFGIVGSLTLILHMLVPEKALTKPFHMTRTYTNKTAELKGKNMLRSFILCIAIVFILLGVMNGGAYDVLVKAINICTECIGLG